MVLAVAFQVGDLATGWWRMTVRRGRPGPAAVTETVLAEVSLQAVWQNQLLILWS